MKKATNSFKIKTDKDRFKIIIKIFINSKIYIKLYNYMYYKKKDYSGGRASKRIVKTPYFYECQRRDLYKG